MPMTNDGQHFMPYGPHLQVINRGPDQYHVRIHDKDDGWTTIPPIHTTAEAASAEARRLRAKLKEGESVGN